jgi:hypothetical protein
MQAASTHVLRKTNTRFKHRPISESRLADNTRKFRYLL